MSIEDQIVRLDRIAPNIPPCRCCGNTLGILDGITEAVREGVGIHTRCIPKHWNMHGKGKNTSRCSEFGSTNNTLVECGQGWLDMPCKHHQSLQDCTECVCIHGHARDCGEYPKSLDREVSR